MPTATMPCGPARRIFRAADALRQPQASLRGSRGVELPEFLLRKLYERGSLRETAANEFAFSLRNPLGTATVVAPPKVTVNGIAHPATRVRATAGDLAAVSVERPLRFAKGDRIELRMPGSLLRGGNHLEVTVQTKEFGELRISAEDLCAEFCQLPAPGERRG